MSEGMLKRLFQGTKFVNIPVLFHGLEYTSCIPETLHWSVDDMVCNLYLSVCQEAKIIL